MDILCHTYAALCFGLGVFVMFLMWRRMTSLRRELDKANHLLVESRNYLQRYVETLRCKD